jgi:predicted ribosome quality control (RQC) complex YloA/Tae2 family protein
MDFLSDLELFFLADKLNVLLAGSYVNNIYGLGEDRFLLVTRGMKPIAVNIDLRLGIWTSGEVQVERVTSEQTTAMRKLITGRRIDGVTSPKGERIVMFDLFRGKLVLELFGKGNMLVLDDASVIQFALREEIYRDRSLIRGKTYSLPPSRGRPLLDITSMPPDFEANVPVAKYLGTSISAPRKFIDELLYRLSIDPVRPASSLTDEERRNIIAEAIEMTEEVRRSDTIYIYRDDLHRPSALSFIRLNHLGEGEMINGVLHGLETVFSGLSVGEEAREEGHRRAEIEAQRKALSIHLEKGRTLRELASAMMAGETSKVADIASKAGYMIDGGKLSIDNIVVNLENMSSAASRIYDLAKDVEAGSHKLEAAINRLESSMPVTKKAKVKVLRAKKWYESFRWFYTSDGLFIIGGRDASGNITLLKKRLEAGDLVFHADVPGSPFFILRGKPSEISKIEVATATISFSRAWREGLLAGDVYYVDAAQVSNTAPSGQFLAHGSAMIYGKKEFIKGLKLNLGVGAFDDDGTMKAYCSPITSADRYCDYYVEIVPGRLPQAAVAKKVYRMLVENYHDSTPSIEDIQRCLPAGNSDILGLRRGRHTGGNGQVGERHTPIDLPNA